MTAVHVTEAHIADGKARNCERCPAALAILDAFRRYGFTFVTVEEDVITAGRDIENEDSFVTAVTPDVLRPFIAAVDNDQPVKPITFDLDLGVLDLARLA